MNEQQVKILLAYLNVGMKVLSARIMLFLAMLLTFVMFVWVMQLPGPYRLGTAVAFAVLVFLPTLSLDKKEKRNEPNQAD